MVAGVFLFMFSQYPIRKNITTKALLLKEE